MKLNDLDRILDDEIFYFGCLLICAIFMMGVVGICLMAME
jgi:hypothetical protein